MQNDHSGQHILAAAMRRFWSHGYEATSMQDVIDVTGANRAAIYGGFGSKRALFVACINAYRAVVVTPAFAPVEAKDANLTSIATFFETQISAAEAAGLPGPGCLFANSMTEVAPHDAEIKALVDAHHERLSQGFAGALSNERPACAARSRPLGQFLAVSAQGLWSYSRLVTDAEPLRAHAAHLISIVQAEMSR